MWKQNLKFFGSSIRSNCVSKVDFQACCYTSKVKILKAWIVILHWKVYFLQWHHEWKS